MQNMKKNRENRRDKKINLYYDIFYHEKNIYPMILCRSRNSPWELRHTE